MVQMKDIWKMENLAEQFKGLSNLDETMLEKIGHLQNKYRSLKTMLNEVYEFVSKSCDEKMKVKEYERYRKSVEEEKRHAEAI